MCPLVHEKKVYIYRVWDFFFVDQNKKQVFLAPFPTIPSCTTRYNIGHGLYTQNNNRLVQHITETTQKSNLITFFVKFPVLKSHTSLRDFHYAFPTRANNSTHSISSPPHSSYMHSKRNTRQTQCSLEHETTITTTTPHHGLPPPLFSHIFIYKKTTHPTPQYLLTT